MVVDGSSASEGVEAGARVDASQPPQKRSVGRWFPPVLTMVLAVGSLAVLRELPYSTSQIRYADEAEAARAPGEKFSVGALSWDLEAYRRAPSLNAFRDSFAPQCGALNGVEAARCVLETIREKSANGEPRHEFVDAQFDPAAVLLAHLSGAPGHCTSRSFMTATALLSMGKPARIAQLLAPNSEGHNIIEVFDPTHGWLLFDPHYESSLLRGDQFVSAVGIAHVEGGLRWRRPKDQAPDPNLFAGSTVSFPDPWLYTRVGERCAVWPFRGCFEQIGPVQFRNGPAQMLALFAFAFFSGLAALLAVRALARRTA
jgi:hypothetical protein